MCCECNLLLAKSGDTCSETASGSSSELETVITTILIIQASAVDISLRMYRKTSNLIGCATLGTFLFLLSSLFFLKTIGE